MSDPFDFLQHLPVYPFVLQLEVDLAIPREAHIEPEPGNGDKGGPHSFLKFSQNAPSANLISRFETLV